MPRGPAVYLCTFDDPPVPDDSDCPNSAAHEPWPKSYIAASESADLMMQTHEQSRCPECGRWKTWTPKEINVNEPDNLALVMVGNLDDREPWEIEVWMRADAAAEGSAGRWYRTGTHVTGAVEAMSWDRLLQHAAERGDGMPVEVLSAATR